jgi:methylmalonyl-CoA/ethylmalonyl-CoA epimerase
MRIDHVGIAVRSLEDSIALYREAFRLALIHREEVPSQGVRVAFLGDAAGSATQVELMEPMGDGGAVARFLAARGPGMHHLAFKADALAEDMRRLRTEGRAPIEPEPRPGSRGHSVCFIHPKHAAGVLVELVG